MIKKWLVGFIKHPIKVVKSIIYRINNKNVDLYSIRISICNQCKDKINIPYVGDVCGICGCILENKARLNNEHCDLCKW